MRSGAAERLSVTPSIANSPNETKTATEKAFIAGFAKQIGDIGSIMIAIASAVLFTILLVSANTMAQAIRERTNELAVLKTLGFSDARVLRLVLAESCLIAVIGGTLVTHPATNVILHGITREYVLELARKLDVPVDERPIQVEELAEAEEAFFTGTTTEVRPTVRIDGHAVGSGRPGPVTKLLFEAFLEGVTHVGAAAATR